MIDVMKPCKALKCYKCGETHPISWHTIEPREGGKQVFGYLTCGDVTWMAIKNGIILKV